MEGFSYNLSLWIRDLVVIYFLKSIVSYSSADFPWAWLLENAGNKLENIMLDVISTDFMPPLVYEKLNTSFSNIRILHKCVLMS